MPSFCADREDIPIHLYKVLKLMNKREGGGTLRIHPIKSMNEYEIIFRV